MSVWPTQPRPGRRGARSLACAGRSAHRRRRTGRRALRGRSWAIDPDSLRRYRLLRPRRGRPLSEFASWQRVLDAEPPANIDEAIDLARLVRRRSRNERIRILPALDGRIDDDPRVQYMAAPTQRSITALASDGPTSETSTSAHRKPTRSERTIAPTRMPTTRMSCFASSTTPSSSTTSSCPQSLPCSICSMPPTHAQRPRRSESSDDEHRRFQSAAPRRVRNVDGDLPTGRDHKCQDMGGRGRADGRHPRHRLGHRGTTGDRRRRHRRRRAHICPQRPTGRR